MGLLGNGWDDPKSQGLLALASGMLQGNFGRGVEGMNAVMSSAQDREMRRQLMQSQIDENAAQVDVRKAAAAELLRKIAQEKQLQDLAARSNITPEMARARSMGPTMDGSSPPDVKPGFDFAGYAQGLAGAGQPEKAWEWQQKLKPEKPKFLTVAEGGRVFNESTGEEAFSNPKTDKPPSAIQEYQFAKTQGYKGTYEQWDRESKKAGAGTTTSITNVNAFEPFKNKVQGEMGTTLVKNFETLQNIPQSLQALSAAKANLAQAGNFVGSGADTKLAVAKFFNNNLGTSIDPNGVKNTEALQSALFYNVMDNLKKMDASPSQQQQKTMQDAFGRITTDPAALPMIIDFYKNQLVSKAREHNRRVKETTTGPSGMQFPYDISIPIPDERVNVPPPKATMRYNPTTKKLEAVR